MGATGFSASAADDDDDDGEAKAGVSREACLRGVWSNTQTEGNSLTLVTGMPRNKRASE